MSDLNVERFVAGGFGENAYVVWRSGSTSAIAIDPGGEADRMADRLSAEGLWLEAIVLTHAHVDHIEGVGRLVARTGASVYLHPDDAALYQHANEQARMFGVEIEALPAPDHALAHGQTLDLAGLHFEVRHVPGHSPGHVILYLADHGVAFTGDVIFQGSIGRTDLPGGSFTQLIKGIRSQVFTLPGETILHPGHGPETEVAHERATNPFLVPDYGGGRLA